MRDDGHVRSAAEDPQTATALAAHQAGALRWLGGGAIAVVLGVVLGAATVAVASDTGRRYPVLGFAVLVLVLFGVVVGTAAGLGAAALALPAIPEFSDAPTAPPLLYDVQVGPVALSVGAALLVLALSAATSSASLVRATHLDQLREAPA